jgi:hypothetical protein
VWLHILGAFIFAFGHGLAIILWLMVFKPA